MTPKDLIDDLRSRINPAYSATPGTESYERRLCVEALEAQAGEIDRLRNQVELGWKVVNFGIDLMTKEQVGQWVGVRHFLEAGTEMYPPFAEDTDPANVGGNAPDAGAAGGGAR